MKSLLLSLTVLAFGLNLHAAVGYGGGVAIPGQTIVPSTQTQVNTGTDTSTFVTPLTLAGWTASPTNLPASVVTNIFAPPQIPGAIQYWASSQGATNLQALTNVADITQNAAWTFTSAGLTNPIYLSTAFNGRPAIGFFPNYSFGAAPTMTAGLTNWNIFTAGITNNFSVTLVVKDLLNHGGPNDPFTPNGFSPFLFTCGTNGGNNNNLMAWQNDSNWRAGGPAAPNLPFQVQYPAGYNFQPYVITLRSQNGVLDAWVNGMRVQDTGYRGTRGWLFNGKILTLGNCFQPQSTPVINPSFGGFYGLFGAWMFTTNGITDDQLYAWHSWAMNYFHFGGGVQVNLIGDSLTAGQYSGAGSNLVALLRQAFLGVTFNNEGVPGQISSTLGSWSSNYLNLQIPTCANVIDVYWWGCNNASNATALASWANDTTNAITFSHSLGHKVLLVTEPSNIRETSTSFLSRNIRNNWIYTNTAFVPDGVIDQAADSVMGTNGASVAQTNLFYSDQLHILGAGYMRLMTNYWVPILSQSIYGVSSNYTGTFTGNGSGLTNLNATSIANVLTNTQSGATLNNLSANDIVVSDYVAAGRFGIGSGPWLHGIGATKWQVRQNNDSNLGDMVMSNLTTFDVAFTNQDSAPTSNNFVARFGPIASLTTTNHIMRVVSGSLWDYWTTNGSVINSKQLAP